MTTPSPIPLPGSPPPAEWWQIVAALGPFAVLLAAVVAATVGLMTLRQRRQADATALAQKTEADMRSEWWSRAQWALDASLSSDAKRQTLGLRIMAVLARSELAAKEEAQIIEVAWQQPLQGAQAAMEEEGVEGRQLPSSSAEPLAPTLAVDDGTNQGDNRTSDQNDD